MAQSRAFEKKVCHDNSEANDGTGIHDSTGMTSTARGALFAFSDRMVSIATSDVPFPELLSILRDMHTKYENMQA